MTLFQKIAIITSLIISNICFGQAKGREYGIFDTTKEYGHTGKGDDVEISHRRNSDNSIDFLYIKKKPGSYTVYYSFANVSNTNFNDGVKKVIIQSNRGRLFKIRAINPKRGINYQASYNIQRGITDPKFDKDFIYLLPYTKGTAVKLLNAKKVDSFAINVTEKTDKVAYKFQTTTPQVHASRKGEVIEVFSAPGKKTRIKIEHTDGTVAAYLGFDSSSIKVKEGQRVFPEKLLGSLKKDKNELFTLYFGVIYKTRVSNKNKTAYITPKFSTSEAIKKLEKNKTYTANSSDDVFF